MIDLNFDMVDVPRDKLDLAIDRQMRVIVLSDMTPRVVKLFIDYHSNRRLKAIGFLLDTGGVVTFRCNPNHATEALVALGVIFERYRHGQRRLPEQDTQRPLEVLRDPGGEE